MNCGLGNLDTLKGQLLGSSHKKESQFDDVIIALGQGVAGAMDQFCNREFAYAENFTEIFMGNRSFWFVKKYPFVSFSKVELKYFASDNWTDISAQPLIINPETGQFNFGYTLGPAPLQVRITYTGGYWFQTLEPDNDGYAVLNTKDDPGYPASLPQAVQNSPNLTPPGIEPYKFILPSQLRLAWLMQCRAVWDSFDKLGLSLVDKPGQQTDVKELGLSPFVRQILKSYIRYQLS